MGNAWGYLSGKKNLSLFDNELLTLEKRWVRYQTWQILKDREAEQQCINKEDEIQRRPVRLYLQQIRPPPQQIQALGVLPQARINDVYYYNNPQIGLAPQQQTKPIQIELRPPPEQTQARQLVVFPQASVTYYKHVYSDPILISHLIRSCGYLQSDPHFVINRTTYQLIELPENSSQFIEIKNTFTNTNKKCFSIRHIQMIFNPYLMLQYELMKERYRQLYGQVTEKLLFHGTKIVNIDSICKYNFDWRLKGTSCGHRFGQGVSFTPLSNYATHYGDKTYNKIMFAASVLVSNTSLGNPLIVIPSKDCDTTTNKRKHVYVKYEDNAFYPLYLIYYEGFDD